MNLNPKHTHTPWARTKCYVLFIHFIHCTNLDFKPKLFVMVGNGTKTVLGPHGQKNGADIFFFPQVIVYQSVLLRLVFFLYSLNPFILLKWSAYAVESDGIVYPCILSQFLITKLNILGTSSRFFVETFIDQFMGRKNLGKKSA